MLNEVKAVMIKALRVLVVLSCLPFLMAFAALGQDYVGTWVDNTEGKNIEVDVYYDDDRFVVKFKDHAYKETTLGFYERGKLTFRRSESRFLYILSLDSSGKVSLFENNKLIATLIKRL